MSVRALAEEQLLATKFFVPRAPHALLARHQLITLLDESLQRPLTLVAAPAGFGKTTLVASWLLRVAQRLHDTQVRSESNPRSLHFAWLSLEDSDSQPQRFWRYLLTALDSCDPGLAVPFLTYIEGGGTVDKRLLTSLLNVLAALPKQLLLVLDDYHAITDTEIHDGVSFLVERLPDTLRLMLLTRADPPLPLSRLRARGQLKELRTEQLRCSEEEVSQFLRQIMGLDLGSDQVHLAAERTEGWLVGLQLVGLWLQGNTNPGVVLAELNGAHHFILDYLVEEVLQRQPEAIRHFLQRTSILDRLSATSCDAVLQQSGSQETLEYLARTNLFLVPLDTQRRWYRYHHLFGETLRQQLHQHDPAAPSALLLRASEWYATNGQIEQAVEYALRGEHWDRAATLIQTVAGPETWALLAPERHMLTQWLQRLPEDVVRANPWLSFTYATTIINASTMDDRVGQWITYAEEGTRAALTQVEQTPQQRAQWEQLLAEILAHRVFLLSISGRYQAAMRLGAETDGLLQPANLRARSTLNIALAVASDGLGDSAAALGYQSAAVELAEISGLYSNVAVQRAMLAYMLIHHGKLHQAWQQTERALAQRHRSSEPADSTNRQQGPPHIDLLRQWQELRDTLAQTYVYPFQAEILREWHQLDAALDRVNEVLANSRAEGIPVTPIAVPFVARVHLSRGEPEAALVVLHTHDATPGMSHYEAELLLVEKVRAHLALNDISSAQSQVDRIHAEVFVKRPKANERRDLALARIALARKQPQEALDRITPHVTAIQRDQRLPDAIGASLLQTVAHYQLGAITQALDCLAEAIEFAAQEGYIQIFVDEGPVIRDLLVTLHNRNDRHTSYLEQIIAAFGEAPVVQHTQAVTKPRAPTSIPSANVLVEPLSSRELDVLRLMARGAANQEIADTLVITVNTAKRHVGNILAKLEVTNRTQAVARARALGLLTDE